MASIVYNPSNAQPESVSVKTGAYTIPAGYYAYVTAAVQGADTFSIGGVVALQGVAAVAASGSGYDTGNVNLTSGATTVDYTYTVPTGYQLQLHAAQNTVSSGSGTYAPAIHSEEVYIGNTGTNIIWEFWTSGVSSLRLAEGVVVGVYIVAFSGTSTKEIWGMIERKNSINSGQSSAVSSGSFWVSAGTNLTTTGGSYTVTLYKNIT